MDFRSPKWTLFGWEGICFVIPEGWYLTFIEGDNKKGYFRLDDPHMVRVEVKWEKAKGRFSPSKVADKYIRILRKTLKNVSDFSVKRNFDFEGAQFLLGRGKGEFFLIKHHDSFSLCLAWNCSTCNKVLLMRVLYMTDEAYQGIAERIYRTLTDHAIDRMNIWSIYGLQFKLPQGFSLEKHSLLSGRIQLTFSDGRQRVHVERLSLAHLLLENNKLEDWFREFFSKELKPYSYRLGKGRTKRHEILHIEGVEKRPLISLRKKRLLHSYLWRCTTADKIFLCMHTAPPEENETLVRKLYHQIHCH